MRLRSVTPIAVRLPLAAPVKMSNVTIATTENLIVRIEDEDGRVGWGEAASAPLMTGETAAGMVAAVRYMAPRLEGWAMEDVAALPGLLESAIYGNESAKAAIETAAYDLMGKRLGAPVYELLGGRRRDDAPALLMLGAGDAERDAADARRKADAGFTAFKVKVGVKDPDGGVDKDVARVERVREVTGAAAQISADANQGYSRDEAVAFAGRMRVDMLDFLEQPVAGRDLEAMRAVAEAGPAPVGADEGIHSLDDLDRHAAARAAQGVSLKTIKLGGLAAVMEAGRRADRLGLKVNLAGKMADSSIASASIAHLAAALPSLDWGASVTNGYLTADVTASPLTLPEGRLAPSDAPGLGVAVDEARVAGFAFQP